MPNRLEMPDEFQHLIEKREGDRRQSDQDGTADAEQLPTGEERRKADRRKEDQDSKS